MDWLINLDYGHWWILAGLLILLELALPTYFFLWLGIAAATVGFLVIMFPSIPLGIQMVVFAALVAVAGWTWYHARKVRRKQAGVSRTSRDHADRNQR